MALDEQALQQVLAGAFDQAADVLVSFLKQSAPEMVRERRKYGASFERRLRKRWQQALDLFEMILVIAQDDGEAFYKLHRSSAAENRDVVFDVLVRLHARACLTAMEVLALLKGGHASGAMARWRTLHEVSLVAQFIAMHGEEVAERYMLHEVCESVRAAKDYTKYQTQLGLSPLDEQVVEALYKQRDAVCARFGPEFKNPYGWAASTLGNKNPAIADLEAAVNLDQMRPYYRMASHGVHPNPKGITFNLGLLGTTPLILAGPTNAGLADPGYATLKSLMQCTITLVMTRPTEENIITSLALIKLVDEAADAFQAAHDQLERDERNIARKAHNTTQS